MINFTYNFDTIPKRAGTETLKFDARDRFFGHSEVIPMWVADMDFESPPAVGEAILRRAAHNLYGYDITGEGCAPALGRWLARRSGWTIENDWVRLTTGVVSGLGFAIRAFTSPGDGIVIQTPVYAPFRSMTEANDRRVVTNPLRVTGDSYEMNLEDLDRKLSTPLEGGGRVSAIILCNPHNPVGRVYSESELRGVGELCVRHDVTIISDEIHSDLVFTPHRHLHIAALDPRFAERCVTFVAPSKTFNIAGLATSAAIISSTAMRDAWDTEYGRSHIPEGTMFGHIALRAAYDHGEAWLEELLHYLRGNVEYIRTFLAEQLPSVRCVQQEGTYLMWLDFRELMSGTESGSGFTSHTELMEWLVHEAGLGLSSGADFGREGIGFARMNIATNRTTIQKALTQLTKAINSIKKLF
ncbi:MAG: PatB family C-S lyase [Alistipes sp.]|nr:PatB family C-S lyase [Alistipes sp.]